MTRQEVHNRLDELIEDLEESSSRARTRGKKRSIKATLDFFKAIKKNLKPL